MASIQAPPAFYAQFQPFSARNAFFRHFWANFTGQWTWYTAYTTSINKALWEFNCRDLFREWALQSAFYPLLKGFEGLVWRVFSSAWNLARNKTKASQGVLKPICLQPAGRLCCSRCKVDAENAFKPQLNGRCFSHSTSWVKRLTLD